MSYVYMAERVNLTCRVHTTVRSLPSVLPSFGSAFPISSHPSLLFPSLVDIVCS